MKRISLYCAYLMLTPILALAQKNYTVSSPDGHLRVSIDVKEKIEYTVLHDADQVIAPSAISMTLGNGEQFGVNPKLSTKKTRSVNETITAPFYKRKQVSDNFNELALNFRGDYSVIFRAYNEGMAYRFATSKKQGFEVTGEVATFNFGNDYPAVVPYVRGDQPASFEEQFWNSFENTYTRKSLKQLDPKKLIFLPAVVEVANGKKVCITEADLESYPGMYLNGKQDNPGFKSVYAPYPKAEKQGGHNNLQVLVTEREAFIARAEGTRQFPWRVIAVASEDKQLADNDLVYKLAAPSRVQDVSWVKPGKVAWDWWNDWNVYNVPFEAGINNETYKHYIDFASGHGIEYVILDEGWAVNGKADLMQVIPEIDLEKLVAYGRQKKVGIVLWAGYFAFKKDMEKVCRHYSDMGIKGFKIDFMDRDDQVMVDFYYKAAETAARHHLFVDFHGAFKPTGLQRTYPNVLNFEGVHGIEQMKWSPPSVDQVTYDVTIPFIRMLAGPMDYTQGAMRNATKINYRPVDTEPMSQGTRCRQLAEYVIFESPFNMLCDAPTAYMQELESTEFIARVPTTWDETKALDGKIGEYVAIARKKGNEWYVGVLTDWNKREMEIDLSFLGEGNYKTEVFKDGANASRAARDYKHETIDVPADKKLKVAMAPGGGYVARIYKAQ